MQPRLLIFASGRKTNAWTGLRTKGGSGFRNLVLKTRPRANGHALVLDAEIVGVVSNFAQGSVADTARKLGVPFVYFSAPWAENGYQNIIRFSEADFVALSGWSRMMRGHDPRRTFNIHPGPIEHTQGLYGIAVHAKMVELFRQNVITHTEVTMHFVTSEYDSPDGVFFRHPVRILADDTPESLQKRVNEAEHYWQPRITNRVVHGLIRWDGKNPSSLVGAVIHEAK